MPTHATRCCRNGERRASSRLPLRHGQTRFIYTQAYKRRRSALIGGKNLCVCTHEGERKVRKRERAAGAAEGDLPEPNERLGSSSTSSSAPKSVPYIAARGSRCSSFSSANKKAENKLGGSLLVRTKVTQLCLDLPRRYNTTFNARVCVCPNIALSQKKLNSLADSVSTFLLPPPLTRTKSPLMRTRTDGRPGVARCQKKKTPEYLCVCVCCTVQLAARSAPEEEEEEEESKSHTQSPIYTHTHARTRETGCSAKMNERTRQRRRSVTYEQSARCSLSLSLLTHAGCCSLGGAEALLLLAPRSRALAAAKNSHRVRLFTGQIHRWGEEELQALLPAPAAGSRPRRRGASPDAGTQTQRHARLQYYTHEPTKENTCKF